MAPVAAACSRILSAGSAPAIHSIAWPGPAMKPSSDIALFTTTLPFPVLVSLILFLAATAYADAVTTGGTGLPLLSPKPGPTALLLFLSKSSTLDRHAARGSFARKGTRADRPRLDTLPALGVARVRHQRASRDHRLWGNLGATRHPGTAANDATAEGPRTASESQISEQPQTAANA